MPMRALASLAVMLSSAASAAPLVHWRAPADCPDEADVEKRVASRLGPDAAASAPINVVVHAEGPGFVAQIGDARMLRSASCAELADAAALVVARLVLEEPAPAPSTPVAPVAPVAPVPPIVPSAPPLPLDVVEHTSRPPPKRELGFGLRLSALTGGGAQPGIALGGELAVPLVWRQLFIEPAGELWATSTSSGAMPGLEASLTAAALRGGWRSSALPLRAWLVAEVGRLSGEGINVVAPRAAAAAWAGVGAGGAFTWTIERGLAFVASAEAIAAIARPRFGLDDGDLVYQPAAVALRLAVGFEVAWP
jgi:hypothetical protein